MVISISRRARTPGWRWSSCKTRPIRFTTGTNASPPSATRRTPSRGSSTPAAASHELVNNYSRISFNFGPTLLAWMQENAPDVYQRVLDADRESREQFTATARPWPRYTIISSCHWQTATTRRRRWPGAFATSGIASAASPRECGWRKPPSIWPRSKSWPSTASASRCWPRTRRRASVRSGRSEWTDVSGGRIDPSVSYVQKLPSGRSIALFFYDGPVSQAVAFEKLLTRGEALAGRLISAFSDHRQGAQLVHIATDGESYGHHHPHGDMALAYALRPDRRDARSDPDQLRRVPGEAPSAVGGRDLRELVLELRPRSRALAVELRLQLGPARLAPELARAPADRARRAPRRRSRALRAARVGTCSRIPGPPANDYIDVLLDRSPETLDALPARHARRTLCRRGAQPGHQAAGNAAPRPVDVHQLRLVLRRDLRDRDGPGPDVRRQDDPARRGDVRREPGARVPGATGPRSEQPAPASPDRARGLREVRAAGPARLAEYRRPLRRRLALPVLRRKRRTSPATTWSRRPSSSTRPARSSWSSATRGSSPRSPSNRGTSPTPRSTWATTT